jgi:hypothetical protein
MVGFFVVVIYYEVGKIMIFRKESGVLFMECLMGTTSSAADTKNAAFI